jgi:hypothetical protein
LQDKVHLVVELWVLHRHLMEQVSEVVDGVKQALILQIRAVDMLTQAAAEMDITYHG